MQNFLIEQNTIMIPSSQGPNVYYYSVGGGEYYEEQAAIGEFYEFDDDGEEDYERYNDEDFYT